jgi:exodeoxyribonuclease VII small subunit
MRQNMIQTYEQSIRRLEAIVAELGNDAKPLADAVALFEEGVGCLRHASAQLSNIEAKIQLVVEDSDGVLAVRDA